MRDVIVLVFKVAIEAQHPKILQRAGNVGRLHEPEPNSAAIKAVSDILDFVSFGKWNAGAALECVAQEQHPLVKNPIMLEMADQHR